MIDSVEMRGIRQFLESWTTFRSRRFLASLGRTIVMSVCTFHSLSFLLSLLFLALFRSTLGMLMSFFRNPSSPIRGTSPVRFFVSERMSRLIDEWRIYTLLWKEWLRRAAVLTCVRGVRSNVLPCLIIRWTPQYSDGSRQILGDGLLVRKRSDVAHYVANRKNGSSFQRRAVEFF